MALKDELRQFVTDNFMYGKPYKGFADDDSFIERGIIDSTAEKLLTDMSNEELLKLLSLDLKRALQQSQEW